MDFINREKEKIDNMDKHFHELVNDLETPLTNKQLESMIERYPLRWGRYKSYIGTLKD
jgi:hypothetical protein